MNRHGPFPFIDPATRIGTIISDAVTSDNYKAIALMQQADFILRHGEKKKSPAAQIALPLPENDPFKLCLYNFKNIVGTSRDRKSRFDPTLAEIFDGRTTSPWGYAWAMKKENPAMKEFTGFIRHGWPKEIKQAEQADIYARHLDKMMKQGQAMSQPHKKTFVPRQKNSTWEWLAR